MFGRKKKLAELERREKINEFIYLGHELLDEEAFAELVRMIERCNPDVIIDYGLTGEKGEQGDMNSPFISPEIAAEFFEDLNGNPAEQLQEDSSKL